MGLSSDEKKARNSLIMRLINHHAKITDIKIELTGDDVIWETKKGHQEWLYSRTASESLEKLTKNDKKSLTKEIQDKDGGGNNKGKKHGGAAKSEATDDFVRKVRALIEAAHELEFVPTGDVPDDGEYVRPDLYGAIRAKLKWNYDHGYEEGKKSCGEALMDSLAGLKPSELEKQLNLWRTRRDQSKPTPLLKKVLEKSPERLQEDNHEGY